MKLCLPVALVVLVATLLHYTEYAAGNSTCPEENCVEFYKCEQSILGGDLCPQSTDVCCSVVKEQHKTHCRHHGGECLNYCASTLQRSTVDCPVDQVCCVLV